MRPLKGWKERALYALMSEISEECYCAGWMSGNEERLWKVVSDPNDNRVYGMGEISIEEVESLREMRDEVGGWVVWWDDSDQPELPLDDWGPRFVTFDEWNIIRRTRYGVEENT